METSPCCISHVPCTILMYIMPSLAANMNTILIAQLCCECRDQLHQCSIQSNRTRLSFSWKAKHFLLLWGDCIWARPMKKWLAVAVWVCYSSANAAVSVKNRNQVSWAQGKMMLNSATSTVWCNFHRMWYTWHTWRNACSSVWSWTCNWAKDWACSHEASHYSAVWAEQIVICPGMNLYIRYIFTSVISPYINRSRQRWYGSTCIDACSTVGHVMVGSMNLHTVQSKQLRWEQRIYLVQNCGTLLLCSKRTSIDVCHSVKGR